MSTRVLNTYYAGRKNIKWSFSKSPASTTAPALAQATAAGDRPSAGGAIQAERNLEGRLSELKALLDKGLIDAEDYAKKKAELLREL